METRTLGRTHRTVGVVGLGAWQLGADWGDVDEDDALAVLDTAVDAGVTFIDTADVYGDGRRERLIGRSSREPARGSHRRHQDGPPRPQVPEHYTGQLPRLERRSRENLGVDTSTWSSCTARRPPSTRRRRLRRAGQLVYDKASPPTASASRPATRRSPRSPGPASPGPDRPQHAAPEADRRGAQAAAQAGVGIIVRVPLASGLLTGKYARARRSPRTTTATTTATVMRSTWARRSPACRTRWGCRPSASSRPWSRRLPLAQVALRWIIDLPEVSVVIPGARNPEQATGNEQYDELST